MLSSVVVLWGVRSTLTQRGDRLPAHRRLRLRIARGMVWVPRHNVALEVLTK